MLAAVAALVAGVAVLPVAASAEGPTASRPPTSGEPAPGTHLDEGGRPFAVEPLPPEPQPEPRLEPAGRATAEATLSGPFANDQTFLLHSRPGSQRVIYLDFKGETVSGTHWSDPANVPDPIIATPYDTDGAPGSFSQAEIDVVQSIWQKVAEDYAPFDVDVTTQDPGAAAINRTDINDLTFGSRALITNLKGIRSDQPAGCGCGGIAYIGTFDDPPDSEDYQPAWIYAGNQGGPKNLAEAVSHEVGHNFGLTHDTTDDDPGGYYDGIPLGTPLWAPIMGGAYTSPVSQFSKGEYPNPYNPNPFANPPAEINPPELDLSIIAAGGAPVVADAHGATTGTATVLAPAAGPWSVDGIIETAADQDWFKVTLAQEGRLTVEVLNASNSPNLDVRLDVRNAAGTIIKPISPTTARVDRHHASGMDAGVIGEKLAAGTYYLSVDGVGEGNPLTGGYSDYASIGGYKLTGSFAPGAVAPAYTPGDFDADGTADEAVFRPSNGTWYVNGVATSQFGANGDIPVPGQWDGDLAADVAVFRPSSGRWYVSGIVGSTGWGRSGDVPVPGDYDGDGQDDIAVFRPSNGTWYVEGAPAVPFGTSGDVPVPGQWDGDPATDIAVYRPSNGRWFVLGGATTDYGAAGDVPVPGQWDADAQTEIAIFRRSTGRWYVDGVGVVGDFTPFGAAGDVPVPGQWDGDVPLDVAVFRPSSGRWYVDPSGNVGWGLSTDIPVTLPYAIRRTL